jgi:hypothetical protein
MCSPPVVPEAVGGAQVESRWAALRLRARPLMLALVPAELLSACGGGGGGGQSSVPMTGKTAVPPVTTPASTGHYVGAVTAWATSGTAIAPR